MGFCGLGGAAVTAFLSVLGGIFVYAERKETDHFLVAAVGGLESFDELGFRLELYHGVEACRFLLDRISKLTHAPLLLVDDFNAVLRHEITELLHRFLHLGIRQNGS